MIIVIRILKISNYNLTISNKPIFKTDFKITLVKSNNRIMGVLLMKPITIFFVFLKKWSLQTAFLSTVSLKMTGKNTSQCKFY